MSRLAATLAIAGAFAITTMAHAQQPDRGPGRPRGAPNGAPGRAPMGPPPGGAMGGMPMGPPMMDVASRFLAQTGELKLTDQQVTRLAAIARRTAEHRESMRASLDSLRPAMGVPRDSLRRREPSPAARAFATRMRDQAHADLRDALAVLTPDQLATAWGMMASRGGAGRAGGFGGRPFMPARIRSAPRGR